MSALVAGLQAFFTRSNFPVLFAGAGVSARAGLPTWGAYLGTLGAAAAEYDPYTKYVMDRAIADGAFGDAATYYMLCRQMPEATKFGELVKPLVRFHPDPLAALTQLPFQAIATTNFDRALFAAYAKYAALSAPEINVDDPTLEAAPFADDFYIARLHGRVEVPSSIRLTTASLADLEKNAAYQRYLEHLFTRRQVLFVGFSFLDPAIRSVLRAVRASTKSMHGQEHFALIPAGAPNEFVAELEAHSIRRIEYSAEQGHSELWRGIDDFSRIVAKTPRKAVDVRDAPFSVAKKYLATAFARARIGRQREPLAQAIAEGVVSGVIQNAGAVGVADDDLLVQLQRDLGLDDDSAKTLIHQAIASLTRAGLCKIDTAGDKTKYISSHSAANVYEAALSRLTDGVLNRYKLVEREQVSPEVRTYVESFFSQLLLRRGWELGAAYAGRRMPEDVDISSVMSHVEIGSLAATQLRGIGKSVSSLLTRPDDDEAELLAEFGRTAFGLELLLEAPHDQMFLQRTLPERIYFDANVLMPAITPGHPHYELFNQTIASLKSSAGSAVLDVSLRVYEGFLNEIVSHKQLAREAMSASGGEGAMWEERNVGLYGSANVNVFVGAYFNYRLSHKDISFDEFLHVTAPYNTETDLKRYIERLGFEVIRDGQAAKRSSGEILHALEKFNASKLEQNKKSAVVIRHDASQLAIINAELQSGVRSVLVSADRGIRFALEYEGYANVSNSILTHLGLAQLVELLVGKLPASRGLASLLWMSPVSSDTNRIRDYLINLALKEHDAALAMGMAEIVDGIAEDAAFELSRKEISLDSRALSDRRELNQTFERIEANFFEKINQEILKIRQDGA